MRTSGRRNRRHRPLTEENDDENNELMQGYIIPYIESHLHDIMLLVKDMALQHLSEFQTIPFPMLESHLLKVIMMATHQHMQQMGIGTGDRGAGFMDFMTRILSWIMPKARSFISVIPASVKEAAGQAATDLLVTGINAAHNKVKEKIAPSSERGGMPGNPLQACANCALQTLIQNDPRGGIWGSVLGGLASLFPTIMSWFTRGSGLGPYWKTWYPAPYVEERGSASRKRPASVYDFNEQPGPSKKPTTRGGTVKREPGQSIVITSVRTQDTPTPCSVTVSPGTKGGRPLTRQGWCNKKALTDM